MKETITFTKNLGNRIKAARLIHGDLTGAEAARRLGVEPHAFRRWERGETSPPVDKVVGFAALVSVSVDWLLTGRKDPR